MLPTQKSFRRPLDKSAILRKTPIFSDLEPDLLTRLGSHAIRQTVKRGTTIFAKGDPGTSLLIVCSGTVKISAPSPDGRGAVFNLITENAVFGEIALLDGLSRTGDATAITDCELMVMERRDLVPLLRERPEIVLKLLEMICKRLRHATEQIEDIMFLDLAGRLAKLLLQLAKQAGPATSGMVQLTQRNLSEMIGMSRESTNKQLRAWEERKWVQLERGRIVILAPDELAATAFIASE